MLKYITLKNQINTWIKIAKDKYKRITVYQGEGMVSFEFSKILKHIPLNLHIIIGSL